MKKIYLAFGLLLVGFVFFASTANAQWQASNQLTDLNTWSSLPGYIGWYNTTANTPTGGVYGSGIQSVLTGDSRFGSQIVLPTFDNQVFYRQNSAGTWSAWYKIWSSANFDPDTYLDRSVTSIGSAGAANSFSNGYTFAYAASGTPWNGSLISYGGFGGSYDTQINSDYGPNGGNHISFRTMNGDITTWNGWNEIYHSGNLNKSTIDFTAQTVHCTNVYSNGNIWAQQIKVASTNPFPDYVFKPTYRLRPLAEVKTYIDQNHHLPDVPTAAEVEKNGLNLGEMNKILVQKVEEITLYLIEKDKQIEAQNNQLAEQNTKLADQQHTNQSQQKQIDALKKSLDNLNRKKSK